MHRDLKPENVLCKTDEEGSEMPVCLIADFGLCTAKERDGTVLGTQGWMAPEIEYMCGKKYNKKVDVYSLGLIYLQLLTNEQPFNIRPQDYAARLDEF